MNKLILKKSKNKKEIFDDIEFIDISFRKSQKKAPTFDLFYSESGPIKNPDFELVAYFEEENKKDIDFAILILNSK